MIVGWGEEGRFLLFFIPFLSLLYHKTPVLPPFPNRAESIRSSIRVSCFTRLGPTEYIIPLKLQTSNLKSQIDFLGKGEGLMGGGIIEI